METIALTSFRVKASIVLDVRIGFKMLILSLLITLASLLFVFLKFSKGKKSLKVKKNFRQFRIFLNAAFQFLFKVKSEDRLNAIKKIHTFFPGFLRIKIFNYDNLIVYDPEMCKKIFNSQIACQRPFRNCIQLETGLLSSECKFMRS